MYVELLWGRAYPNEYIMWSELALTLKSVQVLNQTLRSEQLEKRKN